MAGITSFLIRRNSKMAIIIALVLVSWGAISTTPALAEPSKILNFYSHHKLHTHVPNSAFPIIQPLAGAQTFLAPNQTNFGAMVVHDDSITTTTDPNSLEIARSRGFYVFVGNTTSGAALEWAWTAEFNVASGHGQGSTLTFKGLDRYLLPVREIAVVGGTGKFRFARGWAEVSNFNLELDPIGLAGINFTVYFSYGPY